MRYIGLLASLLAIISTTTPVLGQATEKTFRSLQEILLSRGTIQSEIPYLGSNHYIIQAADKTSRLYTPLALPLIDRERSKPGSLCVNVQITNDEYRKALNIYDDSNVILLVAQNIILKLAPTDAAAAPYPDIPARSIESAGSNAPSISTCFEIGAKNEPEEFARKSSLIIYYTILSLQGESAQCSIDIVLNISKGSTEKKKQTVRPQNQEIWLTQEQLASATNQEKIVITRSCAKDINYREQVSDKIQIREILEKIAKTTVTWDQFSDRIWSDAFTTTDAQKKIKTLSEKKNQTVKAKTIGLSYADIKGLGVKADNAKNDTEESLFREETEITIPPHIDVVKIINGKLSMNYIVSESDLIISGRNSSTVVFRRNFVNNGVLRAVERNVIQGYAAGAIIAWGGSQTQALPEGWAFCDGTTHLTKDGAEIRTPNLRGAFLFDDGVGGLKLAGSPSAHIEHLPKITPQPLFVFEDQNYNLGKICDSDIYDCSRKGAPIPRSTIDGIAPSDISLMPTHYTIRWLCKLP